MTLSQIRALGPALSQYLGEFADCFASDQSRLHLQQYVQGQISNLPRKSVEPIARLMDVPPRTLQEFLSLAEWDADRLRDTLQGLVVRDHAQNQGIAIVDESGFVKKGSKTAGVHRDYCGAAGRVTNCVMSVHLCYVSFDGQFRTMLDSELYLPQEGWNDPVRRHEAQIPQTLQYRPKYVIALEQLRRALAHGVPVGWVTADEWYGQKPPFLEGLEALELRYMLEIPANWMGWLHEPRNAQEPRGQVQNLVRWSAPMRGQPWVAYPIKDTGKGPLVWRTRAAPFWMLRGGQVVGPRWLLAARDVLEGTVKYFLSNAAAGVPREVLVHVGFCRWPVERCLEDEKSELGLGHFEVRQYPAVLRHLRITQLSHLFLARQTQRLRGGKSAGDDLPGARRDQRLPGGVAAQRAAAAGSAGQGRPAAA